MKRGSMLLALAALLAFGGAVESPVDAQDQTTVGSAPSPAQDQACVGTRFLVALEDPITTKDGKAGTQFKARTLEPLAAAGGTILPSGAEIRGHIDRIETAHQTGRARIWLTFDDIETSHGRTPVVAVVSDVPGVHSVKVSYDREGEIEARADKKQQQAEAAVAGAFVGAAAGVVAHSGKDAAVGAAVGAVTAFMLTSGLGQELTLEKNTKLELTLERPFHFGRT